MLIRGEKQSQVTTKL